MNNKNQGNIREDESDSSGGDNEREDMMDLSHGTFDHEINFAENMLQDMEVEVNQAIIKLRG